MDYLTLADHRQMSAVNPPSAGACVLVVEDELALADVIEGYLRRDGFRTERASDGPRALELFRAVRPDLVLLDIMLPGMDGFEILRRIRSRASTPVIMLTARADDIDKLIGFELGADDYVVKPFSPREVVGRVKAVLRRVTKHEDAKTIHRLGPLEVDARQMIATLDGSRLDLTLTEFKLLEHLMADPGRVYSRAELFEAALPQSNALERVVDAHLKNLRRKLELGGAAELLQTVRGVGYRLWYE